MDSSARQLAMSLRARSLDTDNSPSTVSDVYQTPPSRYLLSMQCIRIDSAVLSTSSRVSISVTDHHIAASQSISVSPT